MPVAVSESYFKRFYFISFFLGTLEKLRKATISFVMSVCPSTWNNSAPTGRIMIISRLNLLRIRNVSDKIRRGNQDTHFMSNNFFPKIVPFVR
jgi:hypothetical protein